MGRPEHQKVTQISANPYKTIRKLPLDFSNVILAGGVQSIDLYAPVGYISKVLNIGFIYNPIAGATSGTLALKVIAYTNPTSWVGFLLGETLYSKALWYRYGRFDATVDTQFPEDKTAQFSIIDKIVFDETNKLSIQFYNTTNASDAGSSKVLTLWVQDEKIGG